MLVIQVYLCLTKPHLNSLAGLVSRKLRQFTLMVWMTSLKGSLVVRVKPW